MGFLDRLLGRDRKRQEQPYDPSTTTTPSSDAAVAAAPIAGTAATGDPGAGQSGAERAVRTKAASTWAVRPARTRAATTSAGRRAAAIPAAAATRRRGRLGRRRKRRRRGRRGAMQDRPDAPELLAAVAQYLFEDLLPEVPREHRFQVRVAANCCAIVAREWEAEVGQPDRAPPTGAGGSHPLRFSATTGGTETVRVRPRGSQGQARRRPSRVDGRGGRRPRLSATRARVVGFRR